MKNLLKIFTVATLALAFGYAQSQVTCSGCGLGFKADNNAKIGAGPSIKFKNHRISDASRDSCGGNPNVDPVMDIQFYAIGKNPGETCSDETTNCSEAGCSIELDFILQVRDVSSSGGHSPCLLKGSQPTVKVTIADSNMTFTPSDLITIHGKNKHMSSILKHTFEGSCGDSAQINLHGSIDYTDSNGVKQIVPLDFNNFTIECEECEENNGGGNGGGNGGDPNKARIQTSSSLESVYPNPVNDKVNFVFNTATSSNVQLQITNIYGQTVYQNTHSIDIIDNQFDVDVSQIENGTYFYKYSVNGESNEGKLVIKH